MGLIKSRRFWVTVAGLLAVVFKDRIDLSEEQIQNVLVAIAAWVFGDSFRSTVPKSSEGAPLNGLFESKRFWMSLASIAIALLQDRIPLTPEQIETVVLLIGSWVVGDSLKATSGKLE